MAVAKKNFFKDHYDWLVAIAGLVLLVGVGVLFASSLGNSPDDARASCAAELKQRPPQHKAVAVNPEILKVLGEAERNFVSPTSLEVPNDKKGSFLASECRVYCQNVNPTNFCHKPIPYKSKECPFCHSPQLSSEDSVDVARGGLDSDKDGMPDAWESKYGFNPLDPSDAKLDADGDTFTNLEEFEAKTNPKNPVSHPDFLDFLTVASELRTDKLPFLFKMATPLPSGYRLTFEVLGKDYRKTTTALIGEEIVFQLAKAKFVKGRMQDDKVKSGWRVLKYEKKEDRVARRGSEQKMSVDVSTVDLERISDKRVLTVQVGAKSVSIEEQVDLQWSRAGGKKLTVTTGTEFSLADRKYKVKKLVKGGSGCEVTVVDLENNAEKILR